MIERGWSGTRVPPGDESAPEVGRSGWASARGRELRALSDPPPPPEYPGCIVALAFAACVLAAVGAALYLAT